MRKLQIGVMGSSEDLNYSSEIEAIAKELGKEIALSGNILLYGAEKDYDSVSTMAARGAKEAKGLTVGITYGKGKEVVNKETDVVIASGIGRGGGREFVLVNSCDAIIAISGGSGTLTEIAIAYQLDIPTIVVEGSGGWSDQLAGRFLDKRERRRVVSEKTVKEAVNRAISLAREKLNKEKGIEVD